MSLSKLLNRTCTLILRDLSGTVDDYGNPVPSERTITTVCELQQRQRTEPGDQGEVSDTTWLLVLPAGTTIDTGDAVEVAGERYELVGAPWPARNPRTGLESHVEATVRRTAGGQGS